MPKLIVTSRYLKKVQLRWSNVNKADRKKERTKHQSLQPQQAEARYYESVDAQNCRNHECNGTKRPAALAMSYKNVDLFLHA